MKKVLFLMFLLLLIGLGAASVRAQVRIGGNTPPNASAILDLNVDGTSSGNKGLALPRVALTSNTMLLPGVTSNLTGMMVYNTSTSGTGVNTVGIYVWTGATWNQANLPSTSSNNAGMFLKSNGTYWTSAYSTPVIKLDYRAPRVLASGSTPSELLYEGSLRVGGPLSPDTLYQIPGPTGVNLSYGAWCAIGTPAYLGSRIFAINGYLTVLVSHAAVASDSIDVMCFRSSNLPSASVTWTMPVSTTVALPATSSLGQSDISIPGVLYNDMCQITNQRNLYCLPYNGGVYVFNSAASTIGPTQVGFRCFRATVIN